MELLKFKIQHRKAVAYIRTAANSKMRNMMIVKFNAFFFKTNKTNFFKSGASHEGKLSEQL